MNINNNIYWRKIIKNITLRNCAITKYILFIVLLDQVMQILNNFSTVVLFIKSLISLTKRS